MPMAVREFMAGWQPLWIDAFAACKSWMASRVMASWSVRVTTTPMTSRVCFCAECFNTSISPRSKVLESPIGLLDQSEWNGPTAVSVGRTVWTGRAVQGFKLTAHLVVQLPASHMMASRAGDWEQDTVGRDIRCVRWCGQLE